MASDEIVLEGRPCRAAAIHQGILQRLFGCGDVRIRVQGVAGGRAFLVSSTEMHSITIKSIPDFREVSAHLRANL